jgi:hypothetical protein
MKVGGHLHNSTALPPGKNPQESLHMLAVCSRAGLDDLENRNNLRPLGMISGS